MTWIMNVYVSSLLSSTASSTITATASSNLGQPQQPQYSHQQPSTSVASSAAKSQPTIMTAAASPTTSSSTSTSTHATGEQPQSQRLVIEDSSLNNTTTTKDKPSLSKTNCDEGTNKEEKKAQTQPPLTSSIKQPLALTRTPRPACLFPQAKEWGFCFLLH